MAVDSEKCLVHLEFATHLCNLPFPLVAIGEALGVSVCMCPCGELCSQAAFSVPCLGFTGCCKHTQYVLSGTVPTVTVSAGMLLH